MNYIRATLLNFVIQVKFDLEYLRKLRLGSSQVRLESRFCKFRKYCRKLKGELFYFYCHLIDENYTKMVIDSGYYLKNANR